MRFLTSFLNAIKDGLKDFPTTVVVTLTGCAMAFGSFVMYWVSVSRGWELDDVTFGLMLGFIAATMGISFAWFRHKRNTYDPEKSTPPAKDPEDTPADPGGERRRAPLQVAPESSPSRPGGPLTASVASVQVEAPAVTTAAAAHAYDPGA